MMVLASKLYIQVVGLLTLLEGGSVRYFTNSIAMLFSMVEPPTPPTASGGRPPAPFVGEIGKSGMAMIGHMLSTGRLPWAMESGQPRRGSNSALSRPDTTPRVVPATCPPKPLSLLEG